MNDEISPNAGPRPTELSPVQGAVAPGHPWLSASAMDLTSVAIVSAVFALSYAPNIAWMVKIWSTDDNYSHGFLVLPIALVLLAMRWPGPAEPRPTPWAPGWLVVAAGLAGRAFAYERGMAWSEAASLLVVAAGLGMARMGWRPFLKVAPAFLFLAFLMPLPGSLNTAMSQPLQAVATRLACILLKLTGLWVMPEGNVILVGNNKLEVAEACNGLSMLMSLAATVAAVASLVKLSALKRVLLLMSVIPIALGSNVLRITATAWLFYQTSIKHETIHDWAGYAMMPMAMIMVALELWLMSWLIVESRVSNTSARIFGMSRPPTAGDIS